MLRCADRLYVEREFNGRFPSNLSPRGAQGILQKSSQEDCKSKGMEDTRRTRHSESNEQGAFELRGSINKHSAYVRLHHILRIYILALARFLGGSLEWENKLVSDSLVSARGTPFLLFSCCFLFNIIAFAKTCILFCHVGMLFFRSLLFYNERQKWSRSSGEVR